MQFSKAFGLNQSQAGLDFVDIDTDQDWPLFFDPYAIANEGDFFCQRCDESINSFFQRVLDCVRTQEHDLGRRLLNHLREPNELCLGYSEGTPRGRGIGRIQASQIYDQLASSEAAKTGMLSDLAECELFVDKIGPDKISDITANIIRNHLITYTQEQCELHGIRDLDSIPTGPIWDVRNSRWRYDYANLPVVDGNPVILVPKKTVRWIGDLSHQHRKYYRHFVLNFLRDYHLNNNTALVHVLKNGARRVYKTDLEERCPLSKDFLFRFSRDNPQVFSQYRSAYKKTKLVETKELDEDFDDKIFVKAVKAELASLPPGDRAATKFHKLMVGVLEYLFYPNLTYPRPETPIHEGRKRIDITYANAAQSGFFFRIATQFKITTILIMVECKNYESDPANPELDQLSGRFGPNKGWVGFLIARRFKNRDLFLKRCRDTALDQRGFVLPLVDEDIFKLLDFAANQQRSLTDAYLEDIFLKLM